MTDKMIPTQTTGQTHKLATAARTGATTTNGQEQLKDQFMRLPMELVLNISEQFLNQQYHWCLGKSPSGEPLWKIWNRLVSGFKLENKDQTVKWMFYWSDARPFNIVSAMKGLYTYRPGTPAVLQTSHTLRVEGLKLYLDCARTHIEAYENEHTRALEKYLKTCWRFTDAQTN